MTTDETLKIGLVSISDRASKGVYKDEGIPALEEWFRRALATPWTTVTRLIPDEQPVIEATLEGTGGSGRLPPRAHHRRHRAGAARRDAGSDARGGRQGDAGVRRADAPDQSAIRATAILSRQVAVIRGQALIINLPGQPKSIRETLEGLKDAEGKQIVHGIFAAVPYCIDLIGGPYIETNDGVVKAFRPKSAIRASRPLDRCRRMLHGASIAARMTSPAKAPHWLRYCLVLGFLLGSLTSVASTTAMTAEELAPIEIETGSNPRSSVIWMHGLGADGNDFVPSSRSSTCRRARALRFPACADAAGDHQRRLRDARLVRHQLPGPGAARKTRPACASRSEPSRQLIAREKRARHRPGRRSFSPDSPRAARSRCRPRCAMQSASRA